MSEDRHKIQTRATLFDEAFYATQGAEKPSIPYSFVVAQIERSGGDVDYQEASVFDSVMRFETQLYERRGLIGGPISLRLRVGTQVELQHPVAGATRMPPCVEPDCLAIDLQNAKCVLLIQSIRVFEALLASEHPAIERAVLVCSAGVPSAVVRRLVKRIHEEEGIPVNLLTDNDTWGYFIYSSLVRGCIAPHERAPWLALPDVVYLGLRAKDAEVLHAPAQCQRSWRGEWDARLQAMTRYACFSGDDWQQELAAFHSQGFGVDVRAFLSAFSSVAAFVDEYLTPRMAVKRNG